MVREERPLVWLDGMEEMREEEREEESYSKVERDEKVGISALVLEVKKLKFNNMELTIEESK